MPDTQALAHLKVIVAHQVVQARNHKGTVQDSLLSPHLNATVEFQPPSPPEQVTSGTTPSSKEFWAIIPGPSARGSVLWAFSDTDAGDNLLKLWVRELETLEFAGGEDYRAALAAIEHEYMSVREMLRAEGLEFPAQLVQTGTGNSSASTSSALGCIVGSIIAVVVLGALIGGLIGLGYTFGRNASTSTGNNTNGSSNITTSRQIYATSAPGECDQQGGSWTPNSQAMQSCASGGLILAGPNCPCPLGVVALTSIPSQAYPQDFDAQVSVQSLGTDPTAYWGFKFRQQSADDAGTGRGGYAFLLAQNGQWQFNLYDADGTRHILDTGIVSSALTSTNKIEIMLKGASFSFYVNGQLIAQETDQTYSQGVLCLVAEPGARQLFESFTLSTAQ